jgi:hypothetical protein
MDGSNFCLGLVEAMQSALNSPVMAAAVEDAKNFLDMEKTGLVIVEEKSVIA